MTVRINAISIRSMYVVTKYEYQCVQSRLKPIKRYMELTECAQESQSAREFSYPCGRMLARWSSCADILHGNMGGEHTDRNSVLANEWFKLAIAALLPLTKAGDAKAQYRLGICYNAGYGVAEHAVLAQQLFDQALPGLLLLANAGDAKAANYYSAVLNIRNDYEATIAWQVEAIVHWKDQAARHGL